MTSRGAHREAASTAHREAEAASTAHREAEAASTAHREAGRTGRREAGRTGRREAGSAALELVILAPVLLGLLGLVIAAGRTTVAQGSIDAAARDAARQASISLTPSAARSSARASAAAALRQDGLDCSPVVALGTAGFAVPPGQPAAVTATVSCTVPLANLALPGLPGSVRLHATFTSPLDLYRSR